MDPIVSLTRIKAVPERIDAVALDIQSGALAYAAIDAWELGELLGLDWENAPADWSYQHLAAKSSLSDAGFDRPYAENLHLLADQMPAERFTELEALASDILDAGGEADLPLTPDEIALLEEIYAEENAPDAYGIGLARTELASTGGFPLHFEVLVGDSGDIEEAKGPYQHLRGEFLDTSEWIDVC